MAFALQHPRARPIGTRVVAPAMKSFLCATRYAFFLGKGGAGKSTMAAATALSLADRGKRVLLLGLDVASNLDEMLGVTLGTAPTPVPGAKNLHALNLAPHDIAAFAAWVGGSEGASYDHLIFDTAPSDACALGLPMGWSHALRLDDDLGTLAHPSAFDVARKLLTDPAQNTVVLVARPEASSLREAHRIVRRLGGLGLVRQQLVLNAVFHAHDPRDAQASAREARGRVALDLPAALSGIPRTEVPLEAFNMVGLTALRAVFGEGPPTRTVGPVIPAAETIRDPSLGELTDALSSTSGLVLVVGKGGVGKSAVAAAIARDLATRGARVHLTTSEASLASPLDVRAPERLCITVADSASQQASLEALSRDLAVATREVVVVDGAATGRTLELLGAASAHHRALDAAVTVQSPLARLRDPDFTRVIIVTTAERTAVTEATALQTALRRAGIEPFAWVVNATVASTCTQDPLLRQWLASELVQIARVRQLAERYAVVPWAA
ncbi:MAG: P-loop NTPase [Polyangiaceae bacterium]|nr:P-loop NTPase [Polyangiaceae bacterium]